MDLLNARTELIEIGRRIWVRGFAAANDGNLSVRLGENRFLVTVSGSIKGFLAPSDFVVIDSSANVLEGTGRASSEIRMHLAIYEERRDVEAVVHAHPPIATGFATAGVPLDVCVLPEIVATLGSIATVPYATPSTEELARALRPHARTGHACVLANHGAVTFDGSPFAAYHHLERVEHFAKILLTARLLGSVQVLSRSQVDRLGRALAPRAEEPGEVAPAGAPSCRVLEDLAPAMSRPDIRSTPELIEARFDDGRHDGEDDRLIELIASEVRRALGEA